MQHENTSPKIHNRRSIFNSVNLTRKTYRCPDQKWPGCEGDHSPPSSAEVTNVWIFTFTPPYVLMNKIHFTKMQNLNWTSSVKPNWVHQYMQLVSVLLHVSCTYKWNVCTSQVVHPDYNWSYQWPCWKWGALPIPHDAAALSWSETHGRLWSLQGAVLSVFGPWAPYFVSTNKWDWRMQSIGIL